MSPAEFVRCLLDGIEDHRRIHERLLEHVAMPGHEVYVLHDGRRGWMHGERGMVESVDEEWASIHFRGRGVLKFRLERVSREPDGQNCWHGRLHATFHAAGTHRAARSGALVDPRSRPFVRAENR